jgi:predicted anti-sigma-YlaC factor YlaD
MYDCNALLQRLSRYLDGDLPEKELANLQRQAQAQPECESLFNAMLWVHKTFESAPMLEPSRDLSTSVTRELAWRQRRDKFALAGILALAVLTVLAPIFLLLWAGLTAFLEPTIIVRVLSWITTAVGTLATMGVGLFALFRHLPSWTLILFSTFISLSFLLSALAIVMQQSPELLFTPTSPSQQTT